MCFVITLGILLFLFIQKAYSTIFQRLYLYLVLGTFMTQIASSFTMEHQWQYKGQEIVCVWLGFILLWTYYLVFIFSYEIVGYHLYLVISKIRATSPPQWTGSKCFRVSMEVICILLPVCISTGFAIQAYVNQSYGVAGPWCFVKSLNKDCQPTGFVIQMTFFSINMAVGIVGITASIIVLLVYIKLVSSYKEGRNLFKQTLHILLFQCIHVLIGILYLGVRLYTLLSGHYHLRDLWLIHAFAIPTGTLVFPLGILIGFYPVKKCIRAVVSRTVFCKTRSSSDGTSTVTITSYTTVPSSDRITQPSSTFFSVPHPASDVFSDDSPLISDTKCGSTKLICCWLAIVLACILYSGLKGSPTWCFV